MGIKLVGQDWWPVIQKNRAEEQERLAKGTTPRFSTQVYPGRENIKSGPTFEAHALLYGTKLNNEGKVISRSERTKRRHTRGTRASGRTP